MSKISDELKWSGWFDEKCTYTEKQIFTRAIILLVLLHLLVGIMGYQRFYSFNIEDTQNKTNYQNSYAPSKKFGIKN